MMKKASLFHIAHFATHGEFNDRQPLQSGLLLAKDEENDGYFQVHEIFGMDLRNANLVTLSACETALAKIMGEMSSLAYRGDSSTLEPHPFWLLYGKWMIQLLPS